MIIIKSDSEISLMREAGKIVGLVLAEIQAKVKPGVTTAYLDEIASGKIRENNARSAFLGYNGYPASICTSINEEVVHGIPSPKRYLNEGDILSLDVGVIHEGYCGDAAITVPVGNIDKASEKLLEIGGQCLEQAVEKCYQGNRLSDISNAIEQKASQGGYSVVRDYVGHGIGQNMHEDPQITNFGEPHRGPVLKKGMALAPEPMVNEGTYKVKVLEDNWTVVTLDGKRSCHFEHTVVITENGPEIVTVG